MHRNRTQQRSNVYGWGIERERRTGRKTLSFSSWPSKRATMPTVYIRSTPISKGGQSEVYEAEFIKESQQHLNPVIAKLRKANEHEFHSTGTAILMHQQEGIPGIVRAANEERLEDPRLGETIKHLAEGYGTRTVANSNGTQLGIWSFLVKYDMTLLEMVKKFHPSRLRNRYLRIRFGRALLFQLLKGLCEAEGLGFLMNDIKPDNVMFHEKSGCIKYIDMGMAFMTQAVQSLIEKSGYVMGLRIGTPGYAADETQRGLYHISSDLAAVLKMLNRIFSHLGYPKLMDWIDDEQIVEELLKIERESAENRPRASQLLTVMRDKGMDGNGLGTAITELNAPLDLVTTPKHGLTGHKVEAPIVMPALKHRVPQISSGAPSPGQDNMDVDEEQPEGDHHREKQEHRDSSNDSSRHEHPSRVGRSYEEKHQYHSSDESSSRDSHYGKKHRYYSRAECSSRPEHSPRGGGRSHDKEHHYSSDGDYSCDEYSSRDSRDWKLHRSSDDYSRHAHSSRSWRSHEKTHHLSSYQYSQDQSWREDQSLYDDDYYYDQEYADGADVVDEEYLESGYEQPSVSRKPQKYLSGEAEAEAMRQLLEENAMLSTPPFLMPHVHPQPESPAPSPFTAPWSEEHSPLPASPGSRAPSNRWSQVRPPVPESLAPRTPSTPAANQPKSNGRRFVISPAANSPMSPSFSHGGASAGFDQSSQVVTLKWLNKPISADPGFNQQQSPMPNRAVVLPASPLDTPLFKQDPTQNRQNPPASTTSFGFGHNPSASLSSSAASMAQSSHSMPQMTFSSPAASSSSSIPSNVAITSGIATPVVAANPSAPPAAHGDNFTLDDFIDKVCEFYNTITTSSTANPDAKRMRALDRSREELAGPATLVYERMVPSDIKVDSVRDFLNPKEVDKGKKKRTNKGTPEDTEKDKTKTKVQEAVVRAIYRALRFFIRDNGEK